MCLKDRSENGEKQQQQGLLQIASSQDSLRESARHCTTTRSLHFSGCDLQHVLLSARNFSNGRIPGDEGCVQQFGFPPSSIEWIRLSPFTCCAVRQSNHHVTPRSIMALTRIHRLSHRTLLPLAIHHHANVSAMRSCFAPSHLSA